MSILNVIVAADRVVIVTDTAARQVGGAAGESSDAGLSARSHALAMSKVIPLVAVGGCLAGRGTVAYFHLVLVGLLGTLASDFDALCAEAVRVCRTAAKHLAAMSPPSGPQAADGIGEILVAGWSASHGRMRVLAIFAEPGRDLEAYEIDDQWVTPSTDDFPITHIAADVEVARVLALQQCEHFRALSPAPCYGGSLVTCVLTQGGVTLDWRSQFPEPDASLMAAEGVGVAMLCDLHLPREDSQ